MLGLFTLVPNAVQSVISVTPAGFELAQQPQVAVGLNGQVDIAFGMKNALYVATSSDRGRSYGAPTKVAESGKLSLGMRRGPRICSAKGFRTITAVYGAEGMGRDGDLVAFVSERGNAWSGPYKVNDVAGAAREGLHGMAVALDGTLACAWLDLRQKGTRLYMAISKDGGKRWSKNQMAYESPSGTICQCCHPSLSFDASGKLSIMFRNVIDGMRDMYVVQTSDFASFGRARKLGEGSWKLDSCPMDGGMISAESNGKVSSVWRRQGSVFRTTQSISEGLVSDGRNPWMSNTSSGPAFVWQAGQTILASDGGRSTTKLSENGTDPVVASSTDGKLTIAAWGERGVKAMIWPR